MSLLNTVNHQIISTNFEVNTLKLQSKVLVSSVNQKNVERYEKNKGHWNQTQKQLYYVFLINHKQNFIKKQLRRTDKVFKEMAKFLKTRAADQCRSHHQKMEKKFCSFERIIQSIQDSYCHNQNEKIDSIVSIDENKISPISYPNKSQFQQYKDKTCQPRCFVENTFELQSVGSLQFIIKSPGLFFESTNINNFQFI